MRGLRRGAAVGLALGLLAAARAQDVSPEAFAAWAARNGYQPGRDYRSYLLIAPGNMGPNALPVAPTIRGRVDSAGQLSLAVAHHRAPGDRATDVTAELRYPFGRRASLRVRYTAVEWYRYTEDVALERNTLVPAGSGVAQGDVYVEGLFQVLRDARRWPDLALRVSVKTAASSDVEAMRYTDTPGYLFDVSGGKDIGLAGGRGTLRPYASAGFFVWQRFGASAPQNDAVTYAAGVVWCQGGWLARGEFAGYAGYTGERDQPAVLRAELTATPTNVPRVSVGIGFAHGIGDWVYDTAVLRLAYEW